MISIPSVDGSLNSLPGTPQQQKLRVCDICSAYLSIYDSDRRLADHFGGKLHIGYLQIREKLTQLKEAKKLKVAEKEQEKSNDKEKSNIDTERDRTRDRDKTTTDRLRESKQRDEEREKDRYRYKERDNRERRDYRKDREKDYKKT
jgi:hypothetical protein